MHPTRLSWKVLEHVIRDMDSRYGESLDRWKAQDDALERAKEAQDTEGAWTALLEREKAAAAAWAYENARDEAVEAAELLVNAVDPGE